MDEFRRCGPWRDTTLGRLRHCQDRRLRLTSHFDATNEEPKREPDPALPERKDPPAIERAVITDRTNEQARKLIESVFSEGDEA